MRKTKTTKPLRSQGLGRAALAMVLTVLTAITAGALPNRPDDENKPSAFVVVPSDTTTCLYSDGNYRSTVEDVYKELVKSSRIIPTGDLTVVKATSEINYDNFTVNNNGQRQYECVWTITDNNDETVTLTQLIRINPLPTIRIDDFGTQTIFYGEQFQDITINNEYSVVSLTPSDRGLVYSEGKVTGWLDSVGTYSYTATATSLFGCGSADTTVTISVTPRPITIAAGSATKKYDGTPLTSLYYECTVIPYPNMRQEASILIVDSIASVTIIGSQIDVGSSANVPSNAVITRRGDVTVNMNSSYAVTYANGTLTVTKNDTLITVVPGSGSKVYDGTPLTKTAQEDFTVTGVPEGLTWEATADGTVTNVTPGEGEKAVNAVTSFKIFDANHVDVTDYFTNIDLSATGTLTVTQKPLTITADSDSKEYDGTALTKNSYTHTDLADDETITSVTVTGSQTIAGTSDNVPSAAVIKNAVGNTVTANYNITYENGTLEVTKKPLTITAASDTKVYNGTELTNNTYTNTDLAAGDELSSVTIEGKALYLESSNEPSDAVIKNAAGHTVTDSYDITYVNGTLRIIPTKLYLTAGSATKVYDGTNLTCHTYTCTGLIGNDSIAFKMESVLTYAGTKPNEITEITIYNRDIVPGKDTLVTNGYDIERQNGTLAVTRKPLTITADSDTKVYDGTPLTKKSYTHSELVPGDNITTIIIIGSQTDAGSSANVPEGAHIDNANNDPVTENYNITYVNGTLTVTPKPLTDPPITVNNADNSALTYTGSILQPVVTVKDGDNVVAPKEYTYSYQMQTGSDWTGIDAAELLHSGNYRVTIGDVEGGNYIVNTKTQPFTVLPLVVTTAYIDADAKSQTAEATVLEGHETTLGKGGNDPVTSEPYETWYVNSTDRNYTGTLTLGGNTHIILANGSEMDANGISGNYDLSVYSQGGTNEGILNVSSTGHAITGADITINGGQVTATTNTDGYDGIHATGDIVLGWTTCNDHILASSYSADNSVKIPAGTCLAYTDGGATFILGSTTGTADYVFGAEGNAPLETIAGKTLRPVTTIGGGEKYLDVCIASGDWKLPEGVKAYVVTGIDLATGTVTLAPLTGLPDGVPVILMKDADGNGLPDGNLDATLTLIGTSTDDAAGIENSVPGNISPLFTAGDGVKTMAELIATATGTTGATGDYLVFILENGVFKVVLFSADSQPAVGTCFLIVSKLDVLQMVHNGVTPPASGARQRGIFLDLGDDATGIMTPSLTPPLEGTGCPQGGAEWYDLQGRRLNGQPTQKGVYIRGDRAVVVK